MNTCAHCSAPRALFFVCCFLAGMLNAALCRADQKLEEVALISAAAADLVSTELALEHGSEANPLMENRAVRISAKAASTTLILLLARKLQDNHPKLAGTLRFTGIAFSAGAAGWNLSLTLSR